MESRSPRGSTEVSSLGERHETHTQISATWTSNPRGGSTYRSGGPARSFCSGERCRLAFRRRSVLLYPSNRPEPKGLRKSMANSEPYREVRGHNIETGTVVIFRYDLENTIAAEEANEVVDEIKKANPHWEGPFLVLPTTHSLESLPTTMAYALYEKLHAFFQKHGVPSPDGSTGSADVDGGMQGSDLPGGDDGETVPDDSTRSTDRHEGAGGSSQPDGGGTSGGDRDAEEATAE